MELHVSVPPFMVGAVYRQHPGGPLFEIVAVELREAEHGGPHPYAHIRWENGKQGALSFVDIENYCVQVGESTPQGMALDCAAYFGCP